MKLVDRLKERSSAAVPDWCKDFFAKWGQNSYGENTWRVVWGWDRTIKMPSETGVIDMPVYVIETDWQLDRWILEKWVKTAAVQEDGRFGYYEFVHILQTDQKVFMPLNKTYLELIVTLIIKGRESSTFEENKQAILNQMAAADDAHSKKQNDILDEAFEDVRRHIAMNPTALDDVKISHAVEQPKVGLYQESDVPSLKLRRI